MNNPKPIIGVIGGSDCSREVYALAEETGRRIARAGAILVCGGMGGVMEAACKGAAEAGGITLGILPTETIEPANPYVQVPVASGMGIGRNILIVRTAGALIAINGHYGTLSEISFALQLNKPVFALQPWQEIPGIRIAGSAQEAVEMALETIL